MLDAQSKTCLKQPLNQTKIQNEPISSARTFFNKQHGQTWAPREVSSKKQKKNLIYYDHE